MAAKRSGDNPLVGAVNAIYAALKPLDEETRNRVVSSALSLLGTSPSYTSPGGAGITGASQRGPILEGRQPVRAKSPAELIQDKSPATNAQRITLFAYYREKFEGNSRFSKADLRPYFAKAKQPLGANYDRDFADAVRQGWIYEDGIESYLTSKGLEAVEAGFGGKGRPRGRAAVKKGARKKTGRR